MLIKDYAQFDLADLVADEDFVSWVLAPDEEKDANWSELVRNNQKMAKLVTEARLIVLLMQSRSLAMTESRNEQLWNKIKNATVEGQAPKSKTFTSSFFWRAAAVLLISVLALGGILYYDTFSPSETVATRKGEKTVIHLEDGSEVWLNADSKLSYPRSFDDQDIRVVELQGEAFFEVAENTEKPFIVKTGAIQVKVLGTAFNIRSFDADAVQTTLVRGKVEVREESSNEAGAILQPGEQAVYSKTSGTITVNQVDAEAFAGWKDGKLRFDDVTFSEIETELERWYGVEISVQDELNNKTCRFSTTIDNEPVSKFLEILKASSDIEYVIDGKKILIRGSLCNPDNQ